MYQVFTVAFLSSFEIYVAIATGLAFGLTPFTICISTLIGGIFGTLAFAFLGDKISAFIAKYKKPKVKTESSKDKFVKKLWDKYGVFGVGFIGSFLLGAPISIGIGVGLGVQAKQLVPYCLAAVVLRSIIYSYFFDYIKNLF
jgi:membrane protein YqaA with SNARE-associated domain